MAPSTGDGGLLSKIRDKHFQIVLFSSTAIALYGYDQGMMSLINTNSDYLLVMGIREDDPLVGIIVSVYYLGCAVGAVLASWFADRRGRKPGVLLCLATASLGNFLMFMAGLGTPYGLSARTIMLIGRVVMGLGVGGVDAVVPVYSAELQEDDSRGTALAQEFQANIFGLNMAFAINLALTRYLGKRNQWSWRLPIIIMQIYPVLMFSFSFLLPETPRWFVLHGKEDRAKRSIKAVFGEDEVEPRIKELTEAHEREQKDGVVGYGDMLFPSGSHFHPTVVTVMGQVNQALTGYGAVSVYGPQIFELLGFSVLTAEYITLGNYLFYLAMMTFAWLLIDRKGRRWLLVRGAFWLALSFALLTILGALASHRSDLNIPLLATGIPGILVLYLATAAFGITWLVPPWLIPTEIYPSTARAKGAAVSVIIWGLANFAVTLLTPIGFNNLKYWLFLVFCGTNLFSGWWTWRYVPESGSRSFEENQGFFDGASEKGSWVVKGVRDGEFLRLPGEKDEEGGGKGSGTGGDGEAERTPLLRRSSTESDT